MKPLIYGGPEIREDGESESCHFYISAYSDWTVPPN